MSTTATQYASVGTFQIDPARRDQNVVVLEERIVPLVRQMRGFITGFWSEDRAGGKTHHYVVFTDEPAVRALHEQIVQDQDEARRHGVVMESLAVLPVLAVASTRGE